MQVGGLSQTGKDLRALWLCMKEVLQCQLSLLWVALRWILQSTYFFHTYFFHVLIELSPVLAYRRYHSVACCLPLPHLPLP